MESGKLNEETLDRLIAKAEKLKSILMECDAFVEALDDGNVTGTTLKQSGPNIVYAIGLGDVKQVLNTPMNCFAPEFNTRLEEDLPQIFAPKPKEEPKDPNRVSPIIQPLIIPEA